MADVRDATDPLQAIAALQKQLDDLTTTMASRTSSRPTGDIEPTLRLTPKTGALFMQGQALNRVDYPVLFQWIQDQGLLGVANLFGNGDGVNTFTLPDFRGLVLRGTTSGASPGEKVGADTVALILANMPSHNHSVSAVHSTPHTHNFSTGDTPGDHYGHAPDSGPHECAPQAGGIGAAAWNMTGAHFGGHNHSGTTGTDGVYSHNITQSNVGSGTAIDNRQASIGVNWMIWT